MSEVGKNKKRDAILLIVAGLLIVLALFPTGESDSESEDTIPAETTDSKSGNDENDGREVSEIGAESESSSGQASTSEPIKNVPHEYLPLIPGSTWVYHVRGLDRFVPNKTWTMKILSVPSGEEPGQVEVGFGNDKSIAHVWMDDESIRFDGLALIEPVEFLGNQPTGAIGEFFPMPKQIVQGAIWTQDLERDVIYQYRDKRGKQHKVPARAKQRERAHVQDLEVISVPIGMHQAYQISWLSRIEITAKGRPVLEELTSEPYRREEMWVVSGIGIVRRRIEYPGYRAARISFELMSYERPDTRL
ncbi:MAG: hypothetical protein GY847_04290 [Proteobacteria bacterium]|nr:hypothetical protein [Pseudomonadota bacterium]